MKLDEQTVMAMKSYRLVLNTMVTCIIGKESNIQVRII